MGVVFSGFGRSGQTQLAVVVVFELLVLVLLGFAFAEFLGRLKADTLFEERNVALDSSFSLSAVSNSPGRWAYAYNRDKVGITQFPFEVGAGVVRVGRENVFFGHKPSRRVESAVFESAPWAVSSSPGLLEVVPLPSGSFVRDCAPLGVDVVVLDPGHGGSDQGVVSSAASEAVSVRLIANVVSQRASSFRSVSTRDLSGEADAVGRSRVLRESSGPIVSLHASHGSGVTYWIPMGAAEVSSYAIACHLSNAVSGRIRPFDAVRVGDDDFRSVLRGRVGVVAELGPVSELAGKTTEVGTAFAEALSK